MVTTSDPPVHATSVTTSEHPSPLPLDSDPVPLFDEPVDEVPEPLDVREPLEFAEADDVPLDDGGFDVVLDVPDEPLLLFDPEPD